MKKILGGAIAAALLVGGFVGGQMASGAGESAPSSLVTITPCRLLDTRATSKVNKYSTFGPNGGRIIDAYGKQGECSIPSRATALSLNVTAVNGTSNSFAVLWPADATSRPLAANLNWPAGASPTPNKVDVKLSPDGQFRMFNRAGNVDFVVDVAGFYEPSATASGTVNAVEVVTKEVTLKLNSDETGVNGQGVAECRSGLVAISGGVENELQEALNVRSSRPEPADSRNPTGWYGDVRSPAESEAGNTFTVYAVCIELNT